MTDTATYAPDFTVCIDCFYRDGKIVVSAISNGRLLTTETDVLSRGTLDQLAQSWAGVVFLETQNTLFPDVRSDINQDGKIDLGDLDAGLKDMSKTNPAVTGIAQEPI